MKIPKLVYKIIIWSIAIPGAFLIISLLLSVIPCGSFTEEMPSNEVFLSTNGVHVDIVIPIELLSDELKQDLYYTKFDTYFAFGWGDRDFYLNTPNWSDLKLGTAVNAMFFNSETLMHVSRYPDRSLNWSVVKINDEALQELLKYISQSFKKDESGNKIRLSQEGYTFLDDFYEANGSYSLFTTCNTWVNSALKSADLKTACWTPFGFGILRWYE